MDPKDMEIEWTEEEEEAFDAKTHQQAQEEAHRHHVIQEFSSLILSDGPASVLSAMSKEAQEELRNVILHQYVKRSVEANTGL
jgi:protein required for attachment to host cells|tara:strand:- start:298 stop:546 length:249 start_codon:yes stop_codon:yes gene_type:complete